jgi:hypothetical protein
MLEQPQPRPHFEPSSPSSSFNSPLFKTNNPVTLVAAISGHKPETEPDNPAESCEDSLTGNSSLSGSSTTPDAAYEKFKILARNGFSKTVMMGSANHPLIQVRR